MKNWHSLSVEEATRDLKTCVESGLPETEARERLERHGPNRLEQGETVRWYHMLARQFAGVLVLILIVAAALSFVLEDVIDALAILAIIVLNGLLGFAQEWKAETALKGLKQMLQPHCRVLRGGRIQDVDAQTLVPGDLVLLESGNIVPADMRLAAAVNLKTDESSLTGESLPLEKDIQPIPEDAHISGRSDMVWTGTHVVNGHGRGIVVATGMDTEFGRIAALTGRIAETETRLQRQLAQLGKQLAVLALSVAAATVLIGGLWGKPLMQMVMAGVSLAVAAVPEGLPAVVTITLALGVGVMARRKALLRHLQAAETLGATSVICTDKTGTLTKNEMTVRKILTGGGGVIEVGGAGYDPAGAFTKDGREIVPLSDADLTALLETGRKCSHARIVRTENGWIAVGSSTEAALIAAAQKAGIDTEKNGAIRCEFSFNSTRKRMSVIEENAGGMTAHVKGAPEILLPRCGRILIDGREQPFDAATRSRIEETRHAFAGDGLRTLALARKTLPAGAVPDEDAAESDLTFLGIVGIIDPPRPEVREAIEKTCRAGIRVVMITGDSPDTALAIARQIGLSADRAATGSDLETMDDEALSALLREDVVFARTVPEDKYRIVKLLQAQDRLVAMTGDGVNDAPALKQADIGIAMGIRGTDVARGAADMVLTDDNFASIVGAIEEGRRQYANIRKFVRYLTSSNIGETLAIFLNILLGLPLILLPVQILWVNLVTDSVTALSLSVEKAEGDSMSEPPRPVSQPILDKGAIMALGAFGSYIGLVTLGLFVLYLDRDPAHANTVAFTAMVLMANIHTLNFRSLHAPLARIGWLSNPWLLAAIASMIALQIAAVYAPPLQHVLKTAPLSPQDWFVIVLAALPLLIGSEVYKTVRQRGTAGSGRP